VELVTVKTVDFVNAIRQSVAMAGLSDTLYARRAAQSQCSERCVVEQKAVDRRYPRTTDQEANQ
jgi:hypothetical protein